MVQRKFTNKPGIEPEQIVKSDKQLVNLKPSSPQTHDLKKKMKKSRSVKRSNLDNLQSLSPLRKQKTRPGKPPTQPLVYVNNEGAAAVAIRQKQPPNYMKSTSSFEARKDRSSSATSRVSLKTQSQNCPGKPETNSSVSGHRACKTSIARTSSMKLVRSLTKTTSFKPSRLSKKCSPVVICENLEAQRATCSSTLKESKFPDYLELSRGGTELEGTSVMKVCPYTYCSLNGHHHPALPPLRCFLSARRRALKAQKSFKLGCLSPRPTKPSGTQSKGIDKEPVIFPLEAPLAEEEVKVSPKNLSGEGESRDFFIEIYRKDGEGKDGQDSERSEMDWEAARCSSASRLDDKSALKSQEIDGSLYEGLEGLYDEESVSSGAWLEDGHSESGVSYQQMENDCQSYNQLSDAFEVTTASAEVDGNKTIDETWGSQSYEDSITIINQRSRDTREGQNLVFEGKNELPGLDLPMEDDDIKYLINSQQEEIPEVKASRLPGNNDLVKNDYDGTDKHHTRVIIQVNVSVFVTQKGTVDLEADQGVLVKAPTTTDATCEIEIKELGATKVMVQIEPSVLSQGFSDAEEGMTNEGNDEEKPAAIDEATEMKQMFSDKEVSPETQGDSSDGNYVDENQDSSPGKECSKSEAYNQLNPVGPEDHIHNITDDVELLGIEHAANEMDQECSSKSDREATKSTTNVTSGLGTRKLFLCKARTSKEELPDLSKNLRGSASKKPVQELDSLQDFNPRGPNFLPPMPDPDAETVDLRHQMMDERKNAEEWMVDFALQQAVARLEPARKRKVALLVEAFEKVLPTSKYGTHTRYTSEGFPHSRPMQACS